jgi:hypothetical protein
VEWINGLSYPISESFHPNRTGHSAGYTPLVSPLLTGSTVTVTSAVLSKAAGSADTLARQQRLYAGVDRSIKPEPFRAPELAGSR